MSGASDAWYPLLPDDRSGDYIACILTWSVLLFLSIPLVLIYFVTREFRWPAVGLTTTGLVLTTATYALYWEATRAGLGRHIFLLSLQSQARYFKLMYTAQVLGKLAIATSQFFIASLFQRLQEPQPSRHAVTFIYILIAASATFSLLALLFQCQGPQFWMFEPNRCYKRGVLYYPMITLQMLVEPVICIWGLIPILRLRHLQRGKVRCLILFGIRNTAVGFAVVQLSMSLEPIRTSSDQTWVNHGFTLFEITIVSFSVISAIIPTINWIFPVSPINVAAAQISHIERGYRSMGRADHSDPQNSTAPQTTMTDTTMRESLADDLEELTEVESSRGSQRTLS